MVSDLVKPDSRSCVRNSRWAWGSSQALVLGIVFATSGISIAQQNPDGKLPVTSVPWFDKELMTRTLKSLEKVAERVPAYDLYFEKTAETPQFIAEMLAETAHIST